jgi:hypothetical protein
VTGHVGLVVEGQGDAGAAPLLLRKWLDLWGLPQGVLGKPVSCAGRDRALRANGLEGYVAVAVARPNCAGVLVILDGEGDPVCSLGPTLLRRASGVTHLRVVIALAEDKYESWLRASAETLRLPDLQGDPESEIRRALGSKKYAKPTWQPRLTERMDVQLACSRSASLRRLRDRFQRLTAGL